MKCQAWVDPRKFSKRTKHATPNSAIGLDVLDWDYHCDPKNVGKRQAERISALRLIAVRCHGPISVAVYAGDESDFAIDYSCDWCGQETQPVNLPKDSEELQVHLQSLVDARAYSRCEPEVQS